MKNDDFIPKKALKTGLTSNFASSIESEKSELHGRLKIGIVHEWFVDHAGSEKCVESFNNIFPDSDIFSIVDFLNDEERKNILNGKFSNTSFIQNLPFSKTKFRYYLPIFPHAIEQFDLRNYDIVISNSHSVAKGVLTNTNQLHICYCHTPMRYAWNNYFQYMEVSNLKNGIKGLIAARMLRQIRNWDYLTSNRPDFFIANSVHIARQIKKRYNRDAVIIYPPVDTHKFDIQTKKDDFYLTVSRLVPNKRIDLIVDTFSKKLKNKKLIVVGNGPLEKVLKKSAGSNVEFIDPVPFNILKELMEKARGYISAAEEDFGITVVEAMSAGTPVIAYGKGGTAETVIDNKTGILFPDHTVESLFEGIKKYEQAIDSFDVYSIKDYTNKFNRIYFENNIKEFIAEKFAEFNN